MCYFITFEHQSTLLLLFSTDSDADRRAHIQGGATGLPQAMARADSHPAGVGQGSRWPAATPSAANLLPRHKNPGIKAPGAGQTTLPGREFNPVAFFFFFQVLPQSLFLDLCGIPSTFL